MTDQPFTTTPTAPIDATTPTAPAPAPTVTAPTPAAPVIGKGSVVTDEDGRFGIVVHIPAGGNPHVLWLGEATESTLPITLIRA